MATRDYKVLVRKHWDDGKMLCVGLDTDFNKIPLHLQALTPREGIVAFNTAIIDATKDLVCAFKPNAAFYEAHGAEGWSALRETIEYIHSVAPDVPIILDAKRGDIGNTNDGYVEAFFDVLGVDAVTVHPYLGAEAVQPFLDRPEKGVIVLCRTSNSGAKEFQDAIIDGEPLHKMVARNVSESWNSNGNCSLVVGATYPQEMKEIRAIVGDVPFLIPGIGAQGGDLEMTVAAGKDSRGQGMVISSSRAILYASSGEDFAQAARSRAQDFDSAIRKAVVEK